MIRDYGARRSGMARSRRPGREPLGSSLAGLRGMSGRGGIWSSLAVVAVVGLLWLAWAVQSGQQEIAAQQARQQILQEQHRELAQRQNSLQSRERIEAEATRLGLFPPRSGQVKRF